MQACIALVDVTVDVHVHEDTDLYGTAPVVPAKHDKMKTNLEPIVIL